jgi:hypothetical protein
MRIAICSCGSTFAAFPCHIKSGNSKGTKCPSCRPKRSDRRKQVTVFCAECGKGKEVKQSVYNESKYKRFYCDRDCGSSWISRNLIGEASPTFKTKIVVNCTICGSEKKVHESQYKMYDNFLCSNKCRGEFVRSYNSGSNNCNWIGGPKSVSCAQCGKKKKIPASNARLYKHHFCSRSCRGKWQSQFKGPLNPAWAGGGRSNPVMRSLNHRMSAGMRKSLMRATRGRKRKAGRSWSSFVNYSVFDLKKHLESTLPIGYDWGDFLSGKLHLDHKKPSASFQFSSPEDSEFKKCWALSNLQLLPALENIRKSAKLDWAPSEDELISRLFRMTPTFKELVRS